MSNIWLVLLTAVGISTHNITLINHTGLKIVRVEIGDRKFEDGAGTGEILVSVTPEKHDMKLIFRGGGHIDWPDFDFKGIHQITFERIKNRINARFE